MAGFAVLNPLPATRPDPLESPLKRNLVERAANAFLSGVTAIGDHVDASRAGEMGPEYKVSPFRAGGVSRGAIAAKVLTTLLGSARRDANYRETMRLKGEENRKKLSAEATNPLRKQTRTSSPSRRSTSTPVFLWIAMS